MVWMGNSSLVGTDGARQVRRDIIWRPGSGTYCFDPVEHGNPAAIETHEAMIPPVHLANGDGVRVLTTLEQKIPCE